MPYKGQYNSRSMSIFLIIPDFAGLPTVATCLAGSTVRENSSRLQAVSFADSGWAAVISPFLTNSYLTGNRVLLKKAYLAGPRVPDVC